MIRASLFACLAAVLWAPLASALEAVIEVNASAYYNARKSSDYGDTGLTEGYAPLPVFFEGWKSTPRGMEPTDAVPDPIVSYTWDFGDGSPEFEGFNAAHVYEEPGNYTVTLTVSDGTNTDNDTVTITVNARDGNTYYVDSEIGSDDYDGLSATDEGGGVGPWKTAWHAIRGIGLDRYEPGDQILFKRGQTFTITGGMKNPHYHGGYGYMFGAYGDADLPKPVIQATGDIAGPMFHAEGNGIAHLAFTDLEFRMMSPTGVAMTPVWRATGATQNILMLRCDITDGEEFFYVDDHENNGARSGIFIVDCRIAHAPRVPIYARCSRFALLDNVIEGSDNHCLYLAWLDNAVISNNIVNRPAHGRHALRISSATGDFAKPSQNIVVSKNFFGGWVDPLTGGAHTGGGTRFLYVPIYIGANVSSMPDGSPSWQSVEWVDFFDNTVTDSEAPILVKTAENVRVRDNLIRTIDSYGAAMRIMIGGSFEHRPVKNVFITGNRIYSNQKRPGNGAILQITAYTKEPYNGSTVHEHIVFEDNDIYFISNTSDKGRLFQIDSGLSAQRAELISNNNRIRTPFGNSDNFINIGGSWNVNGTVWSLSQWRTETGNDVNTTVEALSMFPLPGLVTTAPVSREESITLNFDYGFDPRGKSLEAVRLFYRKDGGEWTDSEVSAVPSASDFGDAGSFSFTPDGAGVYDFFLEVEDDANRVWRDSPEIRQTSVYVYDTEGAPEDTVAPFPGTLVVPFAISGGPVTLTYSGAADNPGGSGLAEVRLYYWSDSEESWIDTELTSSGASGSFEFDDFGSDGQYYFGLVAKDVAGNASELPDLTEGNADSFAVSLLDSVAPSAPSLSAPAARSDAPFAIAYSGAEDTNSGLNRVRLWMRFEDGEWVDTGTYLTGASGTFYFTDLIGEGTYYFAAQTEDKAGNRSATPADTGQAAVVYSSGIRSGTMSAQAYTCTSPALIRYRAASGNDSGIDSVTLWAKQGENGDWKETEWSSTDSAGTFSVPLVQDGQYYFAVRVKTQDEAESPEPSGNGECSVYYDTQPPDAGELVYSGIRTSQGVVLRYRGVSDVGSGIDEVRLYVKRGSGAPWEKTDVTGTGSAGTLYFTDLPDTYAGDYEFAIQVKDLGGLYSPTPR